MNFSTKEEVIEWCREKLVSYSFGYENSTVIANQEEKNVLEALETSEWRQHMSDASLSTFFLTRDFGDLSMYKRPFFYFSIGYNDDSDLSIRRAFYRENIVNKRVVDILNTLSSAVKQIDAIELGSD